MKIVTGIALLLSCAAPTEAEAPAHHPVKVIAAHTFDHLNRYTDTLPTGRIVYCYTYLGYRGNGISCVTE